MAYIPVALNLTNKRVVIIGGGKVALHKIWVLQKYGATLSLFGKDVCDDVKETGVNWKEVEYSQDLLVGANIVYCATDDRDVNRQIGDDARAIGAIVNVVDDPSNCDFVSPAIYQDEDMSVAVTSNAKNVFASIKLRDKIKAFLTGVTND
jgi:precorrin-2 dehydrogenase / sirohydrochlorin ferrochelatase